MSSSKKPGLIPAMFKMRCPSCRKGRVFVNKSIFPLNKCLKMVEHCDVCGQKIHIEDYVGQGMNYILTMVTFFLNILWYWPLFGISSRDNSVYYFITVSAVIVILLQPFYMRLSRIIYLYFLVKYGTGPKFKEKESSTL